MTQYFLLGLTIGLSAGIAPGPLLALFLAKSLQQGWKRTLPAAFAPLISDGPIIALALVLLSQIPGIFLNVIRVAGGLFLLYMAWKTIREAFQDLENNIEITRGQPAGSTLKTAVLINLLSPNPYIFWGTVLGPTMILAWRQAPTFGFAFAVGFYSALIGVFLAWIIMMGSMGKVDARLKQVFMIVSGLGLGGFGLFQLAAGIGLLSG